MSKLTGLALFTHDIRWIASLFIEPPLVERSRYVEACRDRVDGLTITVSTEITYFYGKYEIVVRDRHNTFVSVQNLWAMTYLSLTIQERVGIEKAVAIAKRLIKKNKSLLEG